MSNSDLELKVNRAREIIREALAKARNPFTTFTGGKDSLVLLHLLRTVGEGKLPVGVLHIDTTVDFPEIYAFIDKMSRLWNFSYLRERNQEALQKISIASNRYDCCTELKIKTLEMAIAKYGIDYLFVAIRADEQEARKQEAHFVDRGNHIRVHPILDFTESDIWTYIKSYNIPYCSLYDRGYRSLGCVPCTKPAAEASERSGRDAEKEKIMSELRRLGYF